MAKATVTPGDLGIPGDIPMPRRRDWRIGIIGYGWICGAHVSAYRSAGWEIAAVADIDPAARARARSDLGKALHVYEDYHELVADPSVEVVSLLTHPTLREPVVAAAAKEGKPILTEKPLAGSLAEARRMVRTAERASIPLAVSQNYRWAGANFFAHHIIRKGLIGRPFFAGIEICGRQDVELAADRFYSRCEDFLTVQWNTHLGDLLRYWTGRDAQRVLVRTGRMKGQNFVSDNLLICIVDFGEHLTGHILHSELLRSDLGSRRCRVDGDEGSLAFELSGMHLEIQSRRLGPGTFTLDVGNSPPASSFCGPMADLLIWVETGRESQVSARRNLTALRQVFAEHRSARAGGRWQRLT